MDLDLSNPKNLRSKEISVEQATKRRAILLAIVEECEDQDRRPDDKDIKELRALSDLLKRHHQKPLQGIVGVPRLTTVDTDYYTINFSKANNPAAP